MACNTDKKIVMEIEGAHKTFPFFFVYRILGNYKTIIHSTPDQILNEFITGGFCRLDQRLAVTCLERILGIFNNTAV